MDASNKENVVMPKHPTWSFDNIWPESVPVMDAEAIRYGVAGADLIREVFPNVVAQAIVRDALVCALWYMPSDVDPDEHYAAAFNKVTDDLGYTKPVKEPDWPDSVPVFTAKDLDGDPLLAAKDTIARVFVDGRCHIIVWDAYMAKRKLQPDWTYSTPERRAEAMNLAMADLGYTEDA